MMLDNVRKAIETIKAFCIDKNDEECDKCPLSNFCTDYFTRVPECWVLPWKDKDAERIYKAMISAVKEYRAINEQMPRRIYISSYVKRKMEDGVPRYTIGGSSVKPSFDKFCGVPVIEFEGNDVDFDIV